MKYHKFQQIKVRLTAPGDAVRFNAETDKQYARVRGIFVSYPTDQAMIGSLLGLKINGQEVFDEFHEARLLTCGHQVSPNNKFFLFEEVLEAAGSAIEGKLTDSGTLNEQWFPMDVKIYLYLVNDKMSEETQV